MTPAERVFAVQMVAEAKTSGHPFPGYAAAEAFLESANWQSPNGMSGLAFNYHNIFGQKASRSWTGPTVQIQTREVLNGVDITVVATWPAYDSYAEAFADRLQLLHDAPTYYAEALSQTDGAEFVRTVSASWLTGDALPISPAHPVFTFPNGHTYQFNAGRWSTAPNRALQVLQVYHGHPEVFTT